MTQHESLQIISEMIGQAKKNYSRGGSFYFLLWGWVVALANLTHYLLIQFTAFEHPEAVWLMTVPAGIASGIYGARQRKRAEVVTHIDRLYSQIWIAAGVGIIFSLVFMRALNGYHGALILLVSGIGTFISGELMRYKPLIFGGVALWIATVISMFVSPVDQMVVAAIAIVAGYLVPGYLLKSAEK